MNRFPILGGRIRHRINAWWTYLKFHKFYNDTNGQDLIEYALMAGFVAAVAGALMPGVSRSISTIFSKVGTVLTSAVSQS